MASTSASKPDGKTQGLFKQEQEAIRETRKHLSGRNQKLNFVRRLNYPTFMSDTPEHTVFIN